MARPEGFGTRATSEFSHPARAEVVLTGVEMDFWDIVALLVKWWFASLVASLLVGAVVLVVAVIMAVLIGRPFW